MYLKSSADEFLDLKRIVLTFHNIHLECTCEQPRTIGGLKIVSHERDTPRTQHNVGGQASNSGLSGACALVSTLAACFYTHTHTHTGLLFTQIA